MTIQVKGTLTDAGDYPAPNAHILFRTVQGFAGTQRSAELNVITDANGEYDFTLSIGVHLISVRYGDGFESIGKTIINTDTPSPLTLSDLLSQNEPLLPEEITQVNQMLAEIRQIYIDVQQFEQGILDAVQEVSTNAQAVADDKQTVENLAQQVANNTTQVASNTQTVADDKQTVENLAQQVANNTTQVASNTQAVDDDKQTVENLALQVSENANQVSQDKSETATLKDLAKRWAVGLNPPVEDENPGDDNNARYWAMIAKNNANQTFISGGYFTPTAGQEYPDVSGVERDTVWLIKFSEPGGYHVYSSGDLAGDTVKNGFMLVYDTPQNAFDFIPTTLSGVATVNGVSPDLAGNVSLSSENLDDVYSQQQVDSALQNKADKGESFTKQESTDQLAEKADKTQVDNALQGKADKGESFTKQESTDQLAGKADKTQVVLLDADTGVAKLPQIDSDTISQDNPGNLAGGIWYDPIKGEYVGHNGEENTGLGGGGIPNYISQTADFTVEKKKAYLFNVSDQANHVVTIPTGLSNGDWFEVSITGMTLQGQIVDFNFGTEIYTQGTNDYDSLRITSPMTLAFSRINGKWYIVKATASGGYGALEQRIDVSQQVMHVVDQKAYGVNGGSAVVGTQTRTLNTVYHNTIAGASLSSNIITLPAGKYKVCATAPAYEVGRHVIAVVEHSSGTNLLLGTSGFASVSNPMQSDSVARGVLELSSETMIRIVHDIQTAHTDNGLGVGTSSAAFPSVYTTVFIERIS